MSDKHHSKLSSFFTALLWLAPFASFIVGYQALSLLYKTESFETPSVVGLSLQQALTVLSNHDLNPRLLSCKEDADLPAGTVLSQTPIPGTKIKPHQSLFLVTTTKPAQLKAPQLVGKTVQECQQVAKNLGLRLKIQSIASSLPKDCCIGQSPIANAQLTDHVILIYVSAGNTKPVLLPTFKGKPAPTVLQFLSEHSIPVTVHHTHPQPPQHQCTSSCIISDQRPLSGSLISLHQPLHIHLQVGS